MCLSALCFYGKGSLIIPNQFIFNSSKLLLEQLRIALSSQKRLTDLFIIAVPNDARATEHLRYLPVERIKMFLLIQV